MLPRPIAVGKILLPNVRDGSISTELGCPRHVRFPPDSDLTADIAGGPVRATTGPIAPRQTGHYSITSSAIAGSVDGAVLSAINSSNANRRLTGPRQRQAAT